jgi:hypothetical protein
MQARTLWEEITNGGSIRSNTKASEICCEVKSIGFDMLTECKWWLGRSGFEAA